MNPRFDDPLFLQRTLSEFAQGFAALAGAVRGPGGTGPATPEALQESLAAGFQRLFAPAGFAAAAPAATAAAGSGAAWARYQRATARSAELASAIALDASRRLAEALAQSGPEAPPITSLRELHALCIECGEAAYGEAARREEFAAAQAELLMALVELRAVQA
jgi:Poly(R)-hydroxyalkanoic acid synthase subunit (PHA_synth_III_E)